MTEPTPPDAAQNDPVVEPEPTEPQIDWKAEARKWEQRAKENRTRAAETVRTEVLSQISQALGLADTPDDPQALAEQLSAAQEAVADAQLEYDVFKRAVAAGVDANRLLDSLSFRKAVDDLPDDGFEEALDKLIAQWADRDPSLRAGRPAVSTRPVENLRSGALPASDQAPVDADAWIRRMAGIQ
jgi:hypothetical protein